MGQTINSPVDMVSYAGDLRRAAKQTNDPAEAQKIRQSATELEKNGLAKVGQTAPSVGKLLDILV